ncbi:thiamine pyrophosphate-dependent enzyme, partial [Vibrio anguillarum]|uniref:thiamine pyrophosphate-dependent enzyme n=1 Tax=Vibrio anguillarum TaxID=55601 RepID=UPI001EED5596
MWREKLKETFRKKFIDEYEAYRFSPFKIMQTLSEKFSGKIVHYIPDVGNHQMWLAHSLFIEPQQKIHHSGGLGAMGFSLPTAIGVRVVTGNYVVSISGDGGFQLNIQELDVINRDKIPILIIIL